MGKKDRDGAEQWICKGLCLLQAEWPCSSPLLLWLPDDSQEPLRDDGWWLVGEPWMSEPKTK